MLQKPLHSDALPNYRVEDDGDDDPRRFCHRLWAGLGSVTHRSQRDRPAIQACPALTA